VVPGVALPGVGVAVPGVGVAVPGCVVPGVCVDPGVVVPCEVPVPCGVPVVVCPDIEPDVWPVFAPGAAPAAIPADPVVPVCHAAEAYIRPLYRSWAVGPGLGAEFEGAAVH
jgi:hypothetical protein